MVAGVIKSHSTYAAVFTKKENTGMKTFLVWSVDFQVRITTHVPSWLRGWEQLQQVLITVPKLSSPHSSVFQHFQFKIVKKNMQLIVSHSATDTTISAHLHASENSSKLFWDLLYYTVLFVSLLWFYNTFACSVYYNNEIDSLCLFWPEIVLVWWSLL